MDYCNVYINEVSAVAQFDEEKLVNEAIVDLIGCLSLFDDCDHNCVKIQKYYYGGIYTTPLSHELSIQNLSDKDLKRKLKFALKGCSDWKDAPITISEAIYTYKGQIITCTSMSEAYERQFPLLVNFVCSQISEPIASVEKNNSETIDIESYSDSSVLLAWLIHKGWRKREYDLTSNKPPRDEESILTDMTMFEATGYRYKGRTMYRRKGTNHLCYIDSKHVGAAAHIEVFDEDNKMPICKLCINEDREFRPLTKKEKARRLRIDNV